jgi:hypothetical protein
LGVIRQARDFFWAEPVDTHRVDNIFECLNSAFLERIRKLRPHMLKYGGGDTDATGLGQRLKASCYVDSVAVDIVGGGDDVTEVNADAQFNSMRIRDFRIPLRHRLLQRDGASHRLNRTRKFHQNAVAFDPDNPPGMSLDAWPNYVLQYDLQTAPRSYLVLTGKPAIADHIDKQD